MNKIKILKDVLIINGKSYPLERLTIYSLTYRHKGQPHNAYRVFLKDPSHIDRMETLKEIMVIVDPIWAEDGTLTEATWSISPLIDVIEGLDVAPFASLLKKNYGQSVPAQYLWKIK